MYFCLTYLFDRPDSRIYVSPEVIYAYVKEESSATQNNRALFHEDGRLKYVDAFVPFVEENQLDWWTMALLKRNIFKLAKRNQKRLKNLNLSPQPVQALKQRYWPYFYGNLPLLIWQLVRRFQARCQARQQIFWTHDWPREGE